MKRFYKFLFTLIAITCINISFGQDVHFTADQTEGCAPLTVNFTNNSIVGVSYEWYIDFEGTPEYYYTTDLNYTFTIPGNYYVQLTALDGTGGHLGSWSENINVKGLYMFWCSAGDQVCPGEEVHFGTRNYDYDELFWDLGDGTTADYHNPHHTYDVPGTYTISLIMETSCGLDTVSKDLEVTYSAVPEVNIQLNSGHDFCPNDEIQFGCPNVGTTYLWDFDDGSTATVQNPIHTYTFPGSKNVALTMTNLCGNSNSATQYINISNDLPAGSGFNYHPQPVCPNDIVHFNADNIGTYEWDFGDGGTATQMDPQHLFNDTGTYIVELTVTNGCGNSATGTQDVIVQTDPMNVPWVEVYFANVEDDWMTDTIIVCPGEEFEINNHSGDDSQLEYQWHLGNGTYIYDKDLVTSIDEPGIHEITLTVTNNCMGQDSIKKWVNVDPAAMPIAELMTVQDTICPGERLYFVDDVSEADENNYTYSIWYGDGNFDLDMTDFPSPDMPVFFYQYNDEGSFDYTFQVTNICGNSITLNGTIVVTSNPDHNTFYYADNSTLHGEDQSGCPGDEVEFMIFGGMSYEWHFGDGATDTLAHTYHTYADTGSYNAFVIATNGCGAIDTVYSLVSISDSAYADPWFDVYPHNNICVGDTVLFYYPDHGDNTSEYSFYWDFGDGSISTTRHNYHSYDAGGEYLVKLIVTNGCGSDSTFRFVNIDQPIVDFSASSNFVLAGENVTFTNLTTGGNSYEWHFEDGTTSTMSNPTHSWDYLGQYDITLIATSASGCTSELTKENFITVSTIEVIDQVIGDVACFGAGNGYIDIAVTGGYPPHDFDWSHGASTPDVGGLSAGTYTVTITDASGVSISESFTINTPGPLFGTLTPTNVSCFEMADGMITSNVVGGTPPYSYVWSNGMTSPDIGGLEPDIYSVTVTDDNGCTGSQSTTINEPGGIDIFTNDGGTSVCGGNDGSAHVVGVNGHPGPFTYEWNTMPVQNTPTASGLVAGYYTVYVTYGSCVDSAYVAVHDPSGPTVDSMDHVSPVCYGENTGSVVVYASGAAPLTYEWSNGETTNAALNLGGGEYFYTITDATGCATVEQVGITEADEYVISIVGTDPTCYGGYDGKAVAHVSGGMATGWTGFEWSNGSMVDSIIYRPAGTYTVTVTDGECSATASITLNDPPEMILEMYPTDVTFTGLGNGIVSTMIINGQPPYYYEWSTGAITYSIYNLDAGTYYATVTDARGCTATNSAVVNEPEPFEASIMADGPTSFCYGGSVTLDAGDGYNSYFWNTGENTQTITVSESGWYAALVITDVTYGVDSVYVDALVPYTDQEICLVTVDTATGYNLVVWETPVTGSIDSFKVYKETTVASVYAVVASVPYDEIGAYLDTDSDPAVQSYRYKISVVDTCGNESALSEAHKTMHLTVSTGVGVYNLIWEDYEGFDFGSYLVYRGNSADDLAPLTAIASSITTYTDYASVLPYFYQIAVIKDDTCYLSGGSKDITGPYSQSVSNMEDNGVAVGINGVISSSEYVKVYPNPVSNLSVIEFYNPDNTEFELKIYDVTGKLVKIEKDITGTRINLNGDQYQPGYYLFELKGDITYQGQFIVK